MSSPLAKRSVGTSASVLLALLSVLGPTGRSAAADFGPSAPPGVDWESIAACESNGRWHTNTGNGYHGGLQIAPATWRAYGGKRYAPGPTSPRASSRSPSANASPRTVV